GAGGWSGGRGWARRRSTPRTRVVSSPCGCRCWRRRSPVRWRSTPTARRKSPPESGHRLRARWEPHRARNRLPGVLAVQEEAVPSLPIDDENLPLFPVGQVSIMLEVQQAFLRRLDQKGVVSPSRSEGKQRRYSRREITVVQYVVELADQGVSLAGIRRILQLEAQVRELEQECAALRVQLRRYQEREED